MGVIEGASADGSQDALLNFAVTGTQGLSQIFLCTDVYK